MSALMPLKGDQGTDMHTKGRYVMIKLDTETLHLQVNTTKEKFSCQLAEYRGVIQITLILTVHEKDPLGLLSPAWRQYTSKFPSLWTNPNFSHWNDIIVLISISLIIGDTLSRAYLEFL